jgi:predicted acetyltransferase
MLSLKKVQNKDRDLLWNINQKYLYEMTNFYDDPMDENGNYHYGYFDEYFSDPKRKAYFICNDGVLVGFAMLCPYSNIEQDPDYTMAEFTIFPSFRRRHLALDAAKMILARHPGKWEIKYNEKNRGAKNLWHTVAGPYEPEIYHLNEEETVLSFEVEGKIIAACGNDCAACPRYTAYPYEKTEEELHHTAELWMKIGYRDYVAA